MLDPQRSLPPAGFPAPLPAPGAPLAPGRPRTERRLTRGLCMYAALALALCLLWERPLVLLGALLLLAAVYLQRVDRRLRLFVLVGALLGPAAESLAIVSGAWSYAATTTLVPLWLPPAWGLACGCLVDIVEGLLSAGPLRAARAASPTLRSDARARQP